MRSMKKSRIKRDKVSRKRTYRKSKKSRKKISHKLIVNKKTKKNKKNKKTKKNKKMNIIKGGGTPTRLTRTKNRLLLWSDAPDYTTVEETIPVEEWEKLEQLAGGDPNCFKGYLDMGKTDERVKAVILINISDTQGRHKNGLYWTELDETQRNKVKFISAAMMREVSIDSGHEVKLITDYGTFTYSGLTTEGGTNGTILNFYTKLRNMIEP